MSDDTVTTAHPTHGEFAFDADDPFLDDDDSFETHETSGPAPQPAKKNRFSRDSDEKSPSMFSSTQTVRIMSILLWVLLILGAMGGVRALIFPPKAPAAKPVVLPPDTTGIVGYAHLFLTNYLVSGVDDQSKLGGYMCSGAISLPETKSNQYLWTNLSVVQTEMINNDPNYWTVMFAAQLSYLGKNEAGIQTIMSENRYYKVPVLRSIVTSADSRKGYAYCVRSVPFLVSPFIPAPTDNLRDLTVSPNSGQTTDDQNKAIQNFFQAYLVATPDGQSTLQNFITNSSTSRIRNNPPAVFASVKILATGASADSNAQNATVSVDVEATDATGRTQVFNYTLTMKFVGKLWLVDDVLPAAPQSAATTQQNTTTKQGAK